HRRRRGRRLRVSMLVVLSALAGTSALLTAAATQPAPASSVATATTDGPSAATTVATTGVVRGQRLGGAARGAPAGPGVVAAAASDSDSAAITIGEPPLKPPTTWGYEPAALTVKVGATVAWTNSGAVAHTATADDGKAFDSGLMR